MKHVSNELKSWVELIEKFLLIITLFIGLIAGGFKAYDYLTVKIKNENSKNQTFKLLMKEHQNIINNINAQISALDAELSNIKISSPLWESKKIVRQLKAEDRRILLFNLESQIFLHEETIKK